MGHPLELRLNDFRMYLGARPPKYSTGGRKMVENSITTARIDDMGNSCSRNDILLGDEAVDWCSQTGTEVSGALSAYPIG